MEKVDACKCEGLVAGDELAVNYRVPVRGSRFGRGIKSNEVLAPKKFRGPEPIIRATIAIRR